MSQKTGNVLIIIVILALSLYFMGSGSGGRYQDDQREYQSE